MATPDSLNAPSIIGRQITDFRGGQSLSYNQLTALEKRDFLFDAGIRPTAYATLPDVTLGLPQFTESALESAAHHLLRDTVTRVGDELETPKHKLFHTYGTTAKIQFTPATGRPYTGLFAETAHGLLRFSYAGPVIGIGIVPGLGLKLLVDGDHPSENAVMMRMLDGQSEHSVFEHPFTNLLPDPVLTNVIMRAVKQRFETVVTAGHGLDQPVLNFARVQVNGGPVVGATRAPFRVILQPTADARRLSNPQIDFRDDLAQNVPAGTAIYQVLALDEAEDDRSLNVEDLVPRAKPIGTLTTESEFVASAYGDFRLFFKHSDVFLRPAS
ncbi:MAG: hypothetical protein LC797_19245 [Chloroflexi bacterium]|nr:hypothetical protein [Chloroflexota bacterium]